MAGKKKHTNRLRDQSSPYLLQHAHNPVDWYSWGEEALNAARAQDKPILLSVGYAACHWCHVMEQQSFENEEIAQLMNENFINIKVDREERPDLDAIYMNLCADGNGKRRMATDRLSEPRSGPFLWGYLFPSRGLSWATRI